MVEMAQQLHRGQQPVAKKMRFSSPMEALGLKTPEKQSVTRHNCMAPLRKTNYGKRTKGYNPRILEFN